MTSEPGYNNLRVMLLPAVDSSIIIVLVERNRSRRIPECLRFPDEVVEPWALIRSESELRLARSLKCVVLGEQCAGCRSGVLSRVNRDQPERQRVSGNSSTKIPTSRSLQLLEQA